MRLRIILMGTVLMIIPSFVFAASIGDQHNFNISSQYDASGRTSLSATLRVQGRYADLFIEDTYWNGKIFSEQQEIMQKVTKLSEEFETKIYPAETQFWGAEPNPGVDGDLRITILLSNLINTAGGYYDTANQYTRDRVPDSNVREIIFLNIRTLTPDQRVYGFLAHEFQHMITFNQKTLLRDSADDIWLNEARSEYAPTQAGYSDIYEGSNLKRRVSAFVAEPTDSLTEWANEAKDYGQVALFSEYLTEHYGSSILADTLRSPKIGIESLNEALYKNGHSTTFGDIFLNWAVANAINDINFNSSYGYFREGLRQELLIAPTQTLTSLDDQTDITWAHELKDWQAKWFWATGFRSGEKNILQINFSGPAKPWVKVAAVIFYANGTKDVKFFDLSDSAPDTNIFFDLAKGVEKVIIIPVKREKLSGFSDREPLSRLTMNFKRVAVMPSPPTSDPTLVPTPSPDSTSLPQATPASTSSVKPAQFGLKEGDFIRAEGDNDIYIINDFGYKRLVLNPQICLQYAHLGKRGCFAAVKTVSPEVRNKFITSWYFTNGETKDGRVYWLNLTSEDSADIRHLQMAGANFIAQGGDFSAVFLFNTREQNSYTRGLELKSLPR